MDKASMYDTMEAAEAAFRTQARVYGSLCQDCGGVPQADWLPFWVYDELDECLCTKDVEAVCTKHEYAP